MKNKIIFSLILAIMGVCLLFPAFGGEKPYQLMVINPDGSKSVIWTNPTAQSAGTKIAKNSSQQNGVYYYYYKQNPRYQKHAGSNKVPYQYSYSGRTLSNSSPVYICSYTPGGNYSSRGKGSSYIVLTSFIDNEARKYNIDPLLIKLLIKFESNFNPYATSSCGAMGLMQLMPGTAQALGVRNAYDPYANIAGGTKYFAGQLARFGDLELALAAYNAGPGAVTAWGGIPAYPETVNYVNSILAEYRRLRGIY